ncbi:glycosyltransferase [Deinococcus sp. YIM 134068]|uniref:glycosyltransferase n=1 Tax=Deinococcus lichenicola TaxID=3118910 RepID=UPI002F94E0EF
MTRRLRVLFLFEGLYGRGAERVSLGLISRLDREAFEPSIWILRGGEDALRAEVPEGVPVTVVLGEGQRIRHALTRVPATLLRQARGADVIVGTVELMPTYFAGLAGLLTGRPAVGWVRNSLDHTYAEQPAWHRLLSRVVYARLPRLVCVSRGTRDTLARLQRLRDEQFRVVYNPVDLARIGEWQAGPLPEWAQGMTRRPTVLGAGRLTAQKGFDTLIRAHALLRERGVDHDLLIVGEGELRGELESLIRELGVSGSVHLPGHVPNPYPLMRHAAAFALSSRWEGFGNVVVEALACGVPVVSTDCPSGPAEILEGGRHGLLVPTDDAGALASALGTVLGDSALAARLRENGPRRARDFAPEVTVPQWEGVLREVAAGRAAADRTTAGAGT